MGMFYGQRSRVYLEPSAIPSKGMIMAVAAGKHITVFERKKTAPGAGREDVKAAFAKAAKATLGEPNRLKRNEAVKKAMEASGVKTGVIRKKSKARLGSPLYGKVYVLKPGATSPEIV